MNQASRLAAFLGAAVAGSVLALIGSASTWARVVEPSHSLQTSLGTIKVEGAVHSYTAGDLGSPLLPIALLCLVFALLAFLLGPRARTILTALLFAGGVSMVVFTSSVPGPPSRVVGARQAGPARVVSYAGAALALAGAAGAMPLAARVKRVQIPETGPDETAVV